jgi:hypothetical protein
MTDGEESYDRLIAETAEQWFAHGGDLLVWDWDHDVPGTCHPAVVVGCHKSLKSFPSAVKSTDAGFFPGLLSAEWQRAGMPVESMPVAVPVPDESGRMAWFLDLRRSNRLMRCMVGRACMREPRLPAWDFMLERLAFPGASKTSVIHFGESGHICEPGMADLVEVLERMTPNDPERCSFTLVHPQGRGYFSMWMTKQGCVVHARRWSDARGLDFRHHEARFSEHAGMLRSGSDEALAAGENLLPWALGMELALAFHSAAGVLPEHHSGAWVDVTADFGD